MGRITSKILSWLWDRGEKRGARKRQEEAERHAREPRGPAVNPKPPEPPESAN